VAPTVYFLGKGLRNGFLTALNLSQISEFSLVILSVGAQYGHVPQELSSRVLASMLVTSILATYIIKFNDRLARVFLGGVRLLRWKEKGEEESRAAAGGGFRPKVVLLGCFRAGPAFLETVEEKAPGLKDKILVVDYNAALKDSLIGKGFRWAYGDLAHPETLQQLGIDQASVVICSVSDTFLKGITNRRLLGQLKRLAPQACFIMTADSDGEARRMLQEGAAHVIVSGKLAGERIFEQVVRIHGQV
jgi:voltage-gated potassium channel Kch